jgi:hypothetical protein
LARLSAFLLGFGGYRDPGQVVSNEPADSGLV